MKGPVGSERAGGTRQHRLDTSYNINITFAAIRQNIRNPTPKQICGGAYIAAPGGEPYDAGAFS